MAFVVCWAITEEALGHPPTLEEYGEWWRQSRSTIFREQALFREAFPGQSSPQRLVGLLRAADSGWYRRGVSAVARLVVAVEELRGGDEQERMA
jgi:hypothetical protein